MLLDPPYPGTERRSVWHQHFDKPHGMFSIDAVEDDLGRIFVWDAEAQKAICICETRSNAKTIARFWAEQIAASTPLSEAARQFSASLWKYRQLGMIAIGDDKIIAYMHCSRAEFVQSIPNPFRRAGPPSAYVGWPIEWHWKVPRPQPAGEKNE